MFQYTLLEGYQMPVVRFGTAGLRWLFQPGALPFLKSRHSAHQQDNLTIIDFKLSRDDMDSMSVLSRNDGRLFDQYPETFSDI